MNTGECILMGFLTLSIGSFWLGYVYLKGEVQMKVAQAQGYRQGAVTEPEIQALQGEVLELKRQLAALRETTTAYDLSFDSALRRVETRLEEGIQARIAR